MSTAEEVVRSYLATFAGGDISRLNEFVSAQRLIRGATHMREAFPDLSLSITTFVATGEHVAIHVVGRGTHQGEYLGAPPTGRRFEAGCVAMYRVEEGRIADFWVSWDLLGIAVDLQITEDPFPG